MCLEKDTFIVSQFEVGFSQNLEHLEDMLKVFLYGVREYNNIVYVNNDEFINILLENSSH